MSDEKEISRRQFVSGMSIGAASLALGSSYILSRGLFYGRAFPGAPSIGTKLDPSQFPQFPLTATAQSEFTGDVNVRPHGFLWRKAEALAERGGIPAPSETVELVVVGGGVSGLSSAYLLREYDPIVLEQATQFGGNSRGEVWGDTRYSIGAAYMSPPDEDGENMAFFRELGIADQLKINRSSDGGAFIQDGEIHEGFWNGASDPARAEEFKRVYAKMGDINENRMPSIPPTLDSQLTPQELAELDSISFADWLKKELGDVHPHAREYFEQYCWSTYGGSTSEVSAAQMLYFVASDVSSMAVFPGGNSTITQALVQKLAARLSTGHLRTGALVVDVRANDDGVAICYEQPDGKLKTIQAKACVFGSAKFIARKVIHGIPAEQEEAMSKLKWRGYIVANVLLKDKVKSPGFDCFRLTGRYPQDTVNEARGRPFTDVIFASWAADDKSDHSVMTIYKGVPYDGGRPELYAPDSYAKQKAAFDAAIPEIAKIAGVSPDRIEAIRLTRWGHPMPLAQTGLIANGIVQRAHQPIAGRIFFAQQDNWCSPAFEPAFASAQEAARRVKGVLG